MTRMWSGPLLDEADVRERSGRRTRVLLRGVVWAAVLYLIQTAAVLLLLSPGQINTMPLGWVALLAVIMLACLIGPMAWADRQAAPYAVRCPGCDKDLSLSVERLFATRVCKWCGVRVLAGDRLRRPGWYERWQRRRWRRNLVCWFWFWPLLSLGWQVVYWWDPEQPGTVWVPLMIGISANGWALLRTRDLRYVPSFVACLLLAVSGWWVTC